MLIILTMIGLDPVKHQLYHLSSYFFSRAIKRDTFLAQADLEYLDLAYNNISQLEPYYFQVTVYMKLS